MGYRGRYHAQKDFRILIERFYPAKIYRIPRNRLLMLAAVLLAVLIWLLYAWATGSTRWKMRLLTLFVVSSVTAVTVSQSFWPILSFDKSAIYHHRPLWFARKYLVDDLKSIELTDLNLYLTHKSDTVSAVDLSRISPENLQKVGHIVSRIKNA